MSVRVKGASSKILSALADYPIFKKFAEVGNYEPGAVDITISGDENVDIREAIFNCMSKNNLPILQMKSLDLSLEDIFLQVTGGEGGIS
jgi:ABC-2 type transport system ATP-binding protein